MELRNLNTFLRITQLGSFTKAAKELGYATSTITAQIQQLEEEIGTPLFERMGRKNVLTPAGQELIPYAQQMAQLSQQIEYLGDPKQREIRGTLRIGIVESILHSLLLPLLKEYRQQYPDVSISIVSAVSADLFGMLARGEVDLAFTMGHTLQRKDCVLACSHPEETVFVAAPGHPLAKQTRLTLAEVLDEEILSIGENTFLQEEVYKMAAECGRQVHSHIQTESSLALLELAKQGAGLAFLPEYMVRTAVQAGDLRILQIRDFRLPFHVAVFYHKNKWVTPQMRGMTRLVEEYWKKGQERTVPGSSI